MKRAKIIIGNWKMSPGFPEEAKDIFRAVSSYVGSSRKPQVIVCPSHLHLSLLLNSRTKSYVNLGAQDFFHEEKGSYTGEVSADMIEKAGIEYSIIGHSERRALGETDEIINKKIILALKHQIKPIICIGETTRDEEGKYFAHIKEQLEKTLAGVSKASLSDIIIAYEPVWAIGATAAMGARDVHEMTIFIKKTLVDIYKIKEEIKVPILYGGSVDPDNARSIMTDGDADGLLIGRQSLVPENFIEIIKLAQSI